MSKKVNQELVSIRILLDLILSGLEHKKSNTDLVAQELAEGIEKVFSFTGADYKKKIQQPPQYLPPVNFETKKAALESTKGGLAGLIIDYAEEHGLTVCNIHEAVDIAEKYMFQYAIVNRT